MNRYLLKYADRYKVRKVVDGTYEIICNGRNPSKNGTYERNTISVYSFDGKILMFAFMSVKASRAANNLRKKLKQDGIWFETHIQGDTEALILFKEEDLDKVVGIFRIKCSRKQYSPEYKQVMHQRGLNLVKNNKETKKKEIRVKDDPKEKKTPIGYDDSVYKQFA